MRKHSTQSAKGGPNRGSVLASHNPPRSIKASSCSRDPESFDLFWQIGLVRNEQIFAWELLKQRSRFSEIGGQHIGRVSGYPFRQVDILVDTGVESDEDAAWFIADIFQ